MLPIWAIGVIAALVVAGTVAPGIRLWWPSRKEPGGKSQLGVALMTGAVIAFAVLLIQILVETRARQDDERRQQAALKLQEQISFGPSDLAGIGLVGEHLEHFYFGHKNLVGAHLMGAHLDEAILVHADLRRSDLTGAWISNADLSEADLRDATLDGAHLERAKLALADLRGATFEHAHLDGAMLRGVKAVADFDGASLHRAQLDDARLSGADLIRADLSGASLAGADLSGAFLYGADLRDTDGTIAAATLTGAHYDRSTRLPQSLAGLPRCLRKYKQCQIAGHAGTRGFLKTVRERLERHPPHGWTVVPVAGGVTLVSRNRDAEFRAEAVPWTGKTASCVQIYQTVFRAHYARFVRYSRFDRLTLSHWSAVGARYGFTDNGKSWSAVDVYAGTGSVCYRYRAGSSRQLFPLFRSDFALLFRALGVREGKHPSRSLYAWLRA
jgi:uncharacterized protein YjbI with pentapeptide repeats